MPGFFGGKFNASKSISEVINAARSRPDQLVLDPFCGGLSTAFRFGGPVECHDRHVALIAMYKAIAEEGWDPPQSMTYEEWKFCKDELEDTDPHKGFAGFGVSDFNRYFLRYAYIEPTRGARRYFRSKIKPEDVPPSSEYDHATVARRYRNALLRTVPVIATRGGSFHCSNFLDLPIREDVVLYCDPPYEGVTQHRGVPKLDHEAFWKRALEWAHVGVPVFVSSYKCPLVGADVVWTKETPLGRYETGWVKNGKPATQRECLFFLSDETRLP